DFGGNMMHLIPSYARISTPANVAHRLAEVRAAWVVRTLVSLLFGMLLVAAAAFAQVETGQIAGTVTDESGAVVPNATVAIKNLASNAQRTTVTSPAGSYVIPGLSPGTYQVAISSGSFKPF